MIATTSRYQDGVPLTSACLFISSLIMCLSVGETSSNREFSLQSSCPLNGKIITSDCPVALPRSPDARSQPRSPPRRTGNCDKQDQPSHRASMQFRGRLMAFRFGVFFNCTAPPPHTHTHTPHHQGLVCCGGGYVLIWTVCESWPLWQDARAQRESSLYLPSQSRGAQWSWCHGTKPVACSLSTQACHWDEGFYCTDIQRLFIGSSSPDNSEHSEPWIKVCNTHADCKHLNCQKASRFIISVERHTWTSFHYVNIQTQVSILLFQVRSNTKIIVGFSNFFIGVAEKLNLFSDNIKPLMWMNSILRSFRYNLWEMKHITGLLELFLHKLQNFRVLFHIHDVKNSTHDLAALLKTRGIFKRRIKFLSAHFSAGKWLSCLWVCTPLHSQLLSKLRHNQVK